MIQTYELIKQSGPPTENTPGAVGQIYVDTDTGLRWECIESHRETRYKGVREFYDWKCRGLDPEFVVDGLVEDEGEEKNTAPFEFNILETICENVELTDSNPSHTFPTAITLNSGDLYLLDYKFGGDKANDICGLGFRDGDVVRWGTAQANNSVTLSTTGVTDTWRSSGVIATLSIYKVEKVITDAVQYSGLSLEGYNTIASGCDAHAEGCETVAAGMHSHAENTGTEALGDHSHAEGFNTIAEGKYQHVQGKYNVVDEEDKYAHVVGNGTSASTRSNAHTVDWEGNAWYAGDMYVGGEDQESGTKVATVDDIPEVEKPTGKLITLSASDWDADTNTQTVAVKGVVGNESIQLIMPCPAMTSIAAYHEAGILLTAQATDSVTFTAETIPTEDIKVYVVMEMLEIQGYLTFSSPEAFSINVVSHGWDGTMEYSTDTKTWSTWDGSSVSAEANGSLYFRGTGNTKVSGSSSSGKWVLTGSNIACTGNIETLLDYATVETGEHPTMAESCYYRMFYKCTALTTAPALPATTLTDCCYQNMFQGCTALTTAPALPATTLATYCYEYMFQGCTALTTAPALPATTLANYCYHYMFSGCIALTTAPALPATTLENYCCHGMFYGCTALTTAPELPATTLTNCCYREMFYGCTALTTAPALPATTLENYCYHGMFQNCTALTTAPALPATTLTDCCYYYMFYGCTALTAAPELPATTLASNCYQGMFYGCAGLKFSATQTDEYTQAYRIPTSGEGTAPRYALTSMFTNTGGTFTDTPEINTTYYLHSSNAIV